MLMHNIIELIVHYKRNPQLFFLQPVVLGAIIIFLLQLGGITNFLMIHNGKFELLYNSNIKKDPFWLVFGMSVNLGASVMYWAGYKLSLGNQLFSVYNKLYSKFLNYRISVYALIGGWLVGCIIKLIINYYGAIGHKYIVLIQSQGHIPEIVSRLKVFENVSLLFWMMILFLVYQQGRNKLLMGIIIIGGLFEFVFAITSGARGTIVFLFLVLFFVDYFFRRRIKILWLLLFGIVLYASMTILSKYKDYVFTTSNEATMVSNPFESIELAIKYNENKVLTREQKKAINQAARISIIGRFNYVNEMVQMMQYKNNHGLDANDPDFVTPFITFPVFAVLPKFYLFGIVDEGYGMWVTRFLTGGKRSSTAISPVGFLYMSGGVIFVLFIFALLGILMKAAGYLLLNVHSVMGFVIFLVIMSYLVMFDTVVYGTFINLIRFGILLPPVLWFFLRK